VGQHTIGGIGQLWQDDRMLGAVYYNLYLQQPNSARQDKPPQDGDLVSDGELVFLGEDIELDPAATYRLLLEDARTLDVTVTRDQSKRRAPYQLHTADGRIRPAS
jgi:hypothetical protein